MSADVVVRDRRVCGVLRIQLTDDQLINVWRS
jgi:hypothetical protein